MKTCLKRVHNLVFKLYLRMCSFTESKKHYISENTFGSLVYDNYLIDFPKIIDLSVLYADTNYHQLLTRMLENVVKCQPKYTEDLLKGEQIEKQLLIARSNLMFTFREIIKICFIDKLMDPKTKKQLKVDLMDQFIETLTSASFEKNFINDYCPQYAVEKDLEELSKNSELTQFESLDKTRIDYLKSLIQSSISTEGKSCDISNEGKDLCQIGGQVNGVESSDEVNENLQLELNEDNLPPPLSSLDRSLQKVSTKKTNEKKVKTNEKTRNSDNNDLPQTIPQTIPQVIDERKNIYNNDEFDIFRNKNIDLNRIHLGKKEKTVPKMDVKTREKIMSLHYMALEEEENEAMRVGEGDLMSSQLDKHRVVEELINADVFAQPLPSARFNHEFSRQMRCRLGFKGSDEISIGSSKNLLMLTSSLNPFLLRVLIMNSRAK
ncbi:unnamed protein product [Oppiella nova]|uniref:Uncharacterized protein n=1 Tax=Oppiella nova TaxID=334625 RepID=A0A7R9M5S7_9ACAR|nr:unnamed protein product [Oppiella nova]CAG2171282.1 unnamed protein product [Oppiella nova]